MKPRPFFLCAENSSMLNDTTVGNALVSSNQNHLWGERSSDIDTIVIHFMSDRFRHPRSPFKKEHVLSLFIEYGVSAHYLILRNGTVLHLVPESQKAWHAGGSIMPMPDNRTGVNDFSIGIELCGTEHKQFTKKQYTSLITLSKDIQSRQDIRSILGHEDISGERAVSLGIRQDCKIDPGPYFDWHKIGGKKIAGEVSSPALENGTI